METQIKIEKVILDKCNRILKDEDLDLRSDEIITFTGKFEDGFEADIKLVLEGCYIDPVLFDPSGYEVAVSEPCFDRMEGDYFFSVDDKEYKVSVIGV
jgi:hypothetical protein